MQKLKHVKQKRSTDCGIACIRTLARVSDLVARAAVGIKKDARSHRTQPEQIRTALASFGFRLHREVLCDDWEKLPRGLERALLAVNYKDSNYTWHWVVLDRADPERPILDPKSKSRRGISRTKLCSYYRVEAL